MKTYEPPVKAVRITLEDSSMVERHRRYGGDVSSNLTPSARRYFSYKVNRLNIYFCVLIVLLLLPVKVGGDFNRNYSLVKYKRSF